MSSVMFEADFLQRGHIDKMAEPICAKGFARDALDGGCG
jgi:hypothetical protein